MMAIAVFCDDEVLLERALLYYLHGDGDGSLAHYIYDNGQCQESGRDQQHTQLGLAHMGDACQIAWNQGWDLYGANGNSLLRGFEYTAAYNLGEKVEFRPDIDRTGQYRHNVISPPSSLRPIYEQIFAHYRVRRGLPAPAVQKAVEKIRPEGAAQGADHTGFGTLLYACAEGDPDPVPRAVPPAALYAVSRKDAIALDWLRARNAESVVLERDGAGQLIDSRGGSWIDHRVISERRYTYGFSAPAGIRFRPAPVSITAGLPAGWASGALGNPSIAGDVQFKGKVVTLCAAGKGLMQPADEGQFAAAPEATSGIVVRSIPKIASQFVVFGVACRSGFAADAPAVTLLVLPESSSRGRRGWHVRLMARDSSGKMTVLSEHPLTAPVVTYGRLVGPVWFRMESTKSMLEAAFSADGVRWTSLGRALCPLGIRIGLVAASGIPEVATSVRFEMISL